MRIGRSLLVSALLTAGLGGSVSAHVRPSPGAQALGPSRQTLVAPWKDYGGRLERIIRQTEPALSPEPRLGGWVEIVLADVPLQRQAAASAPAWLPACAPRPPLRAR